MEHEGLLLFAFIAFEALTIVLSAQRGRDQGLRLAAREQSRAMNAG